MARVIADADRRFIEAQKAIESTIARYDSTISALHARAELAELKLANVEEKFGRVIEARLAELRDGEPGRDGADGKDGRDGKDGAPGRDGVNGKDADQDEIAARIDAAVARAVANLPPPRDGRDGKDGKDGRDGIDGKSVSPADVAPLIAAEVKTNIAAIPAPKDGRDGLDGSDGSNGRDGRDGADGRSVSLDEIDAIIAKRVAAVHVARAVSGDGDGTAIPAEMIEEMVRRAVAEIPPPRDGKDGRDGRDGESVSRAEVEAMVASAVSAIPAPRDGVDGKDGNPGPAGADGESVAIEDVLPFLTDAVSRIAASIPVPKDGRDGRDGSNGADGSSIAREDVIAMVREAVASIPVPKDGRDGKDGAPGRDGERGPEGAPGKLPIVKAWTDGVHYEGDVVTHMGGTWQAIRDTGQSPSGADWVCLACPGEDGRSFNVRGTWAASEAYQRHDIVMLSGSSFVALRDDPGACPGDGWQLWASRGRTGKPGDPGPRGERGSPGDDASEIVGFYRDDDGLYVLTFADGTEKKA